MLRRIYVHGYHVASVRLLVTPIIDGRFRSDLTKYAMVPAPESGRFDRFSLVIPIEEQQADFEDVAFAPRGTAFAVYIEIQAPRARAFLTSAVPYLEPVTVAGGPRAT